MKYTNVSAPLKGQRMLMALLNHGLYERIAQGVSVLGLAFLILESETLRFLFGLTGRPSSGVEDIPSPDVMHAISYFLCVKSMNEARRLRLALVI